MASSTDSQAQPPSTLYSLIEYMSIDYPALIQNDQKALNSLGGTQHLSSVLTSTPLPTTLPMFDTFESDEKSNRIIQHSDLRVLPSQQHRLVLRIKSHLNSANMREIHSVQLLGRLKYDARFRALNDFNIDQISEAFPLPLLYTRYDYARPFSLLSRQSHPTLRNRDLKRLEMGQLPEKAFGKRRARQNYLTFDTPTPNEPPYQDAEQMRKIFPKVFDHLKVLFQQNPIYSRASVVQSMVKWASDNNLIKLPQEDKESFLARCTQLRAFIHELLALLPYVAYRFSGGPWRNSWIRLGFNPRLPSNAVECLRYQSMEIRLNSELFQAIQQRIRERAQKATNPLESSMTDTLKLKSFTLRSEPKRATNVDGSYAQETINDLLEADLSLDRLPLGKNCTYLLIDVLNTKKDLHGVHTYIQELFRMQNVSRSSCDVRTGWMSNSEYDKLRSLLNQLIDIRCLESGLPLEVVKQHVDATSHVEKKRRNLSAGKAKRVKKNDPRKERIKIIENWLKDPRMTKPLPNELINSSSTSEQRNINENQGIPLSSPTNPFPITINNNNPMRSPQLPTLPELEISNSPQLTIQIPSSAAIQQNDDNQIFSLQQINSTNNNQENYSCK